MCKLYIRSPPILNRPRGHSLPYQENILDKLCGDRPYRPEITLRVVNYIGSAGNWADVMQTSKDQVACLTSIDKMNIFAIMGKKDKMISKIL